VSHVLEWDPEPCHHVQAFCHGSAEIQGDMLLLRGERLIDAAKRPGRSTVRQILAELLNGPLVRGSSTTGVGCPIDTSYSQDTAGAERSPD
jgi:hypothetical protein